jgi:hypothetical protein
LKIGRDVQRRRRGRKEEKKKKKRKERARVRAKGDRGEVSIPPFLRKRNHALSPLLREEREKD